MASVLSPPRRSAQTGVGTQAPAPVTRASQTRRRHVNRVPCSVESCTKFAVARNFNGLCSIHRGRKNQQIDRINGPDYRRLRQQEAELHADEEAIKNLDKIMREDARAELKRQSLKRKRDALEEIKNKLHRLDPAELEALAQQGLSQ
jgi:hypothetical protein